MWLLADFESTALFSLRSSIATSSGGKTNLVPTMYAVKLALVDAAFRAGHGGEHVFEVVKHLPIRFRPPAWAVVTNSFMKILREPKDKKAGPAFISSVAYREFVYYGGRLTVAIGADLIPPEERRVLEELVWHVHYLGKRGGFVQVTGVSYAETLDASYSFVLGDGEREVPDQMVVQYLDDVGPRATFQAISTYSREQARLRRDRVLVPVGLPYVQVASSRGYTLYRRVA